MTPCHLTCDSSIDEPRLNRVPDVAVAGVVDDFPILEGEGVSPLEDVLGVEEFDRLDGTL